MASVELKNTADGLIYSVEQALLEYGDSLDADERLEVDQSLDKAKKALEDSNPDQVRASVEDLQQLAYRMTEAMYERMSPGGADPEPEAE